MLLSCGDSLIDFVPAIMADGRDGYAPAVGGSCLNVAIAMARLGAKAGFVGGLSTDMFGEMIARHAQASGVDLAHVQRFEAATALAFVRFAKGEPDYAFFDETSATRAWRHVPGALPLTRTRALHIGSTSLVPAEGFEQGYALVQEARSRTLISFDPNCRPGLVRDIADFRARMECFFAQADILRLSEADLGFLYSGRTGDAFAADALRAGAALVVLTRGAEGVQAWTEKASVTIEAPRITVADTIGAGDAFQGALLVALEEGGHLSGREALAAMSPAKLHRVLSFAVHCAALSCSRPGADPPYRRELAL